MSQSISRLSKVLYDIINASEFINIQVKQNLFTVVHDFHFTALLQNLKQTNKISELENRIVMLEKQNEEIIKNK
jgi:hypothetical protein